MCFEHINRLRTHHENHEILTLRVLKPLLQSWMARAWHPSVFFCLFLVSAGEIIFAGHGQEPKSGRNMPILNL